MIGGAIPTAPDQRGYHVAYHGAATPCPGCGRTHWHVGRLMAECAFCSTAIALPESIRGAGAHRSPARRVDDELAA